VRAMLLGALGFRGNRNSYDRVFTRSFEGEEIAYLLCAIYYLQRDIISSAVIEKVFTLLNHKSPSVREHAGYFFYVMKRQNISEPGLVEKLAQRLQDFNDPASAFVLRYIAAQKRDEDIPRLLEGMKTGKSARAESVAVEGLGFFTQHANVRTALIKATCDSHFHVAEAAAELLAGCDSITPRDIQRIKKQLQARRVHHFARPHLWRLLWKQDEKKFVEDIIQNMNASDGISLMTAIESAPDIAHSAIEGKLKALLELNDPQINTLLLAYIDQRDDRNLFETLRPPAQADPQTFLKLDWDLLAKYGRHPKIIFTSGSGDIVIELDVEQAPMGSQNLITLIEAGRFDQLYFYRVVPNHVIQAGPQDYTGHRIRSEFTRIPKLENTFGLGDYGKDTITHHIAITHLMRPHNEGKYTNLGLVIEGEERVKRIHKYERLLKARVVPDKP
ncbi:MAG: peptidylprolyl isomerase, partial [Verrucomicrobiota bacterium]